MKYHSLMKFMILALEADVLLLAVETASIFLEHARRVQQSHLRRPAVTRLFKIIFITNLSPLLFDRRGSILLDL